MWVFEGSSKILQGVSQWFGKKTEIFNTTDKDSQYLFEYISNPKFWSGTPSIEMKGYQGYAKKKLIFEALFFTYLSF